MPWMKLDDRMAFHRKIMDAGNEATGAWARAGAWSCGEGTDGHIPIATAHTIAKKKVWEKICRAGLAHEREVEKKVVGYDIHDFLQYNPSAGAAADAKDEKSERKREAGRIGGLKSAAKRAAKAQADTQASASVSASFCLDSASSKTQAESKQNEAPIPIPIQEDPPNPPGASEDKSTKSKALPSAEPFPPGRTPIPRSEPILSVGAGSQRAIEVFAQAVADVQGGEPPVFASRARAGAMLVDLVNGFCRGPGDTQTTSGALAELDRLTRKWAIETTTANRDQELRFRTRIIVESLGAWFSKGGHKDDADSIPEPPTYDDAPVATPRQSQAQSPEQAARVRELLDTMQEPSGL